MLMLCCGGKDKLQNFVVDKENFPFHLIDVCSKMKHKRYPSLLVMYFLIKGVRSENGKFSFEF